ncbi:AAA-like domain protein (plasmid) [Corynebacterium atrinae]|uniref:ATP/GTP-binding protein n=1 Tax=Corynebacterium atrinae TaxID=1336740 RepID=UPI0025B508F7|nr:ATP/GTP-binding protein [Corynebacterium atrinae]WJY64754.1 AAA-like domain protein [Corynebacterium atrinae]
MTTKTLNFEELQEAIAAGEATAPHPLTRQGRNYRRWSRAQRSELRRAESWSSRTAGAVEVVGERAYSRATVFGFRGRAGGTQRVVSGPKEWQTTTNFGAGFNPNVVGAPAPVIGTPLGTHVTTGAEVCCDPLSWFREGIISNPSCFVLSLPGLGKSTLIRKMLMGHVAQGHTPIMAGDIKGEYVGFTKQVGGQVITIGHGLGHLNPLDVGALGRVIPMLETHQEKLEAEGKGELLERAKEQVHGRQVTMVTTLVGLGRGERIRDYEVMLISAALRELYDSHQVDWLNPPVLSDLITLLERGSDHLRTLARARDDEAWNDRVDDLVLSLNALLDGQTGQIFSGQTTTPIEVDSTAVCIDVSAIDRGDSAMKAAVMMACWSAAFGAIEAAHMLSDAGLTGQRIFAVATDEMWQVLSSAPGMVAQVDGLTRLNRTDATVLYMITHTFKDLEALPTEEDRKTAMGFIERAGMVITGGLPTSELDILSTRLSFTPAEGQMITSWSTGAPPKRSRTRGARATPPGRGRFMIKPSKDGSPGIPVQTILMPSEIEHRMHDTNVRFDDFFRAGDA